MVENLGEATLASESGQRGFPLTKEECEAAVRGERVIVLKRAAEKRSN